MELDRTDAANQCILETSFSNSFHIVITANFHLPCRTLFSDLEEHIIIIVILFLLLEQRYQNSCVIPVCKHCVYEFIIL